MTKIFGFDVHFVEENQYFELFSLCMGDDNPFKWDILLYLSFLINNLLPFLYFSDQEFLL